MRRPEDRSLVNGGSERISQVREAIFCGVESPGFLCYPKLPKYLNDAWGNYGNPICVVKARAEET